MTDVFEVFKKELHDYVSRVSNANTEAKIIHEFTSFIQKVFDVEAKELDFEVSVKSSVREVRGRIDAVFKSVILEFKQDLGKDLKTAKFELEKYFQSLYEKDSKLKYLGIATDGISFKIFQPVIVNGEVSKLDEINEINLESSAVELAFNWFDSYFFSSTKIIPTSEHLKQTFGINSPTYAVVRQELFELFDKVKDSRRIKIKFENWSRYLEIVYGDRPNEINLFIAHTYLSTFVKLLVYLKLTSKNQFKNYDILPILYGNVFSNIGIHNFVEDDFFTWIMYITIRKRAGFIFEKILRDLEIYDLDKINEDILKELYQDMVHPVVRKLLGEFYTPDWLAEKMVVEVLGEKPEQSVLDPSCGSGTFLFKTILYKIKKFRERGEKESKILSHILENVIGFDIHPLAALIAKTNYLLGLRELIHSRVGPISIPVYLSDSIKIPDKKMKITNDMPTFEFSTHILEKKFSFPESIIDDNTKMDEIIEKMKEHGHELEDKMGTIRDESYNIDVEDVSKNLKESFKRSLFNITDENIKIILLENIHTLFELIEHNSDSIWPYILRNMYRPIAASHKKVDVLLGNPPWIALQFIKNRQYQDYLKSRSKHYGLMDLKKIQNITHLELATLFFCQAADTYLKANGKIAFVMPRSVLVASHHERFRNFENPRINIVKIYDLEESKKIKVSPLFKIPSCVLIGIKDEKTIYPVPSIVISGNLSRFNAQLEEAQSELDEEKSTYSPVLRNTNVSYYYDKFSQGATIVPGSFWFVEIQSDSFLGFNPQCPFVISEENKNAKLPWKDLKLKENVEKQFLFTTIISNDVVPFGYRKRKLVVLPVFIKDQKTKIITSSSQLEIIPFKISKYLETAENYWNKFATDKSKTMTIYDRLNYQKGLTNQKPHAKFKVLYVSSATYMTSCVIRDDEKYHLSIAGKDFEIDGVFADSTTYWFDTDDEDEAYYLSSFLNSPYLDNLIKPHQARGSFGGARHIHKIPLSFEIPKYDKNKLSHQELAHLGKICHKKTAEILSSLTINQIGKIRSTIRTDLSAEFRKSDKIVSELLKILK